MTWPSPEVLAQIGGWCFAVIVCAVVIGGFIKGDLVPGWIHKREIERADKITALISEQTAVMEKQTDNTERQISVITSLGTQIETLVTLLRPSVRG